MCNEETNKKKIFSVSGISKEDFNLVDLEKGNLKIDTAMFNLLILSLF